MQKFSEKSIYILFFLFGFVIIVLGFGISYVQQKAEVEQDFRHASEKTLLYNETLIKTHISHYQREIETLAQSPFSKGIIQSYLNGDKKRKQVSIDYLLDLARGHEEMMQVRYIGNSGEEVIRIDRKAIGSEPYALPEQALQNKKDRYYYKALLEIPEGMTWYSQIDLNVEHGKIEEPFQPTLRIGIPLFLDNEREGMIIVNIFMQKLLAKLQGSDNYQLYVSDSQGNFLLHPDPEFNWSKYRHKGVSLFDEFPELSAGVLQRASSVQEGVFFKELDFGQSEKYYLIARLNKDLLEEKQGHLLKVFLLIGAFVLIITFPFGLIIIRQAEHITSRLSAIIESLGDGIFIVDKEEKTRYVNNKATKVFGYSANELLGKKNHLLLQHGDAEGKAIEEGNCPIHNVNKTRQQYHSDDNTFVTKNGKQIHVEYTTTPFFVNNKYEGSITLFRDITQRIEAESEIRRLSKVVEQIDDMVTITDYSGVITYVNEAFIKFTGYSKEDAIGQTPSICKSNRHSSAQIEDLWNTILAGKVYRGVFINKKKNGELFYEEKTITPMVDEKGNIVSFVSTGKDISKRVKMEIQLEKLASTDYLTGLYNRFKFEELFNQELLRSKRYHTPLSAIMLDIDYFKKINDTFGHEVGDIVLKEVGHLLASHIRQSDISARWGGEEFMILTPEVDLESAYTLAENLRTAINGFTFDNVCTLSCSFGVVQLQEDEDFTSLCKRVDMALYAAKEAGRNCTVKG